MDSFGGKTSEYWRLLGRSRSRLLFNAAERIFSAEFLHNRFTASSAKTAVLTSSRPNDPMEKRFQSSAKASTRNLYYPLLSLVSCSCLVPSSVTRSSITSSCDSAERKTHLASPIPSNLGVRSFVRYSVRSSAHNRSLNALFK